MGVNKVIYGNSTIIDITDSTVTPDTLMSGYTAYAANGDLITGEASGGDSNYFTVSNGKLCIIYAIEEE